MLDFSSYSSYLQNRGSNLGQIKKNQSDNIINNTFTSDATYKRVYILTKDGWKWEDAKYQFHTAPSMSKDAVDYYLQFRPKVHYPVGSYIIVPDDTSPNVNLSRDELENPFLQKIQDRTQWWIIVGRDEANAFVRYMILKCDWEFKWVYKGKLMSCWGCSKSANSYTSGVWRDEISLSTDNLTSSWLPDTHHVYGDKLEALGMCDTRTIMHEQRFFFSNNDLDPKIYQVTKITDLNPQGIIKISIKQDDYNEKRDNKELHVCDYYTDEGKVLVNIEESKSNINKTSIISWAFLDESGLLIPDNNNRMSRQLTIGKTFYFSVEFSDENVVPNWKITFIDENNEFSLEERKYFEGLIKLTSFDNSTLALTPGKATSIKGKKFTLSVSDVYGEYASDIVLEVAK